MSAQVSLDDARYHSAESFQRLLQQSVTAMKEIPGVESAAVGLNLPFERGLNDGFHLADGSEDKAGHMASSAYVTPEYFHVCVFLYSLAEPFQIMTPAAASVLRL